MPVYTTNHRNQNTTRLRPNDKQNNWENGRRTNVGVAPFAPPLLVPASGMLPLCPLLCASAVGSTVIVATGFVTAVVEYVWVALGLSPAWASADTKTRAAPGAGTVIVHALADWSQLTV